MSSHELAGAADDEVVTSALEALDGLEEREVGEHLEAFERAHRELRAALEI